MLALFVFPTQTFANPEINELTSQVHLFSDGSTVPNSISTLTTSRNGATMTIRTSDLPVNTANTVWWVIFNHPDKCTNTASSFRCGISDLTNSDVHPSLLFATGNIVGRSGIGSFTAHINPFDKTGALFGPGLINPQGADIHLVVHNHGALIPGMVNEQIHTFGGGCNNNTDFPGAGTPGPNICQDLQFAVLEQR